MIRVVAFSDSHGNTEALERCVRHALRGVKPYAAVFLGDGESDFERLHPLLYQNGVHAYQVAGNNDWGSSYERDFTINIGSTVIYVCHGHQWRVKYSTDRLCYAAMEHGAQAVLYGHTHIASVDIADGIVLLNPGAVYSCGKKEVRYAELCVAEGGILLPKLIQEKE